MIEIQFYKDFAGQEFLCKARVNTNDPTKTMKVHWEGETTWIGLVGDALEDAGSSWYHFGKHANPEKDSAQGLFWNLPSMCRVLRLPNSPRSAKSGVSIQKTPEFPPLDDIDTEIII